MLSLLRADAFLSPLEIEAAVTRALEEDLGRAGDITSIATVPEDTQGRAVLAARKSGVIAGLPLVEAAFRKLSPGIEIAPHARDGAAIQAGAKLMTISGNARAILGAERVGLNYLGHLSGIATATAIFAERIAHTKARVVCTRKTTPGLRALEKYAVRCGGGFNHRFGLDDAILIKDNHVAVAGGIKAVLTRGDQVAGHLVKIEIEVDSLDQLQEVLDVGLADVVMIDNFDLDIDAQGRRHGRRPPRHRSLRRHHARERGGDRRNRRRLFVVRCAHALGAESRRRPGYRDVAVSSFAVGTL